MIVEVNGSDISSFIKSIKWNGDKSQMARKLSVSYLHTSISPNVQKIEVSLGDRIVMRGDAGKLLFDGIVIDEEKDDADTEKNITAADYAFYLKSEVYGQFEGTPAQVTAQVLNMFGIPAGSIMDAPGNISILATGDKTIYQVIDEAYAGVTEGINLYMDSLNLCIEKAGAVIAGTVTGNDYIIKAKYKSSMENMVNRVAVIDKNSKLVNVIDSSDIQYGVVQKVYKQEEGKDATAEAIKEFKSIENSGSITVRGNTNFLTGRSIVVQAKNSKLQGIFKITSDSHSFSDTEYTTDLTLDFTEVK